MRLEERLQQEAEGWLVASPLSPDQAQALARMVLTHNRQRRRLQVGAAATVAVVVLAAAGLSLKIPVVAREAAKLPVIGTVISWFDRHHEVAPSVIDLAEDVQLDQAVEDHGVTFQLNRAVSTPDTTYVLFRLVHDIMDGTEQFKWAVYYDDQQVPPDQITFNLFGETEAHPAVGGFHLPPLPREHVAVRIVLDRESANSPAAHFSVTFPLARRSVKPVKTLATNIPVEGPGIDWTIEQIALTPTETVVRVSAPAAATSSAWVDLYAGGHRTPVHVTWSLPAVDGRTRTDYVFDRLTDDDMKLSLSLRLSEIVQFRTGGPEIPLTPGASYQDPGLGFTATVDSVTVGAERSTFVLGATLPANRDPGDPIAATPMSSMLGRFSFQIVDADGNVHSLANLNRFSFVTDQRETVRLEVPGALKLPATLKATRTAEPDSSAVIEVPIPIK
ncbi:MAG: DUF4179 domain-containing protein [Mycobacterium leprae]